MVAVNVNVWPAVEGFGLEVSASESDALTDSESGAEVAPAVLESPPYTAVIECGPRARVEVENVATPEATVEVPISVLPSRNCTLPVAVEGVMMADRKSVV